MQTFYEVRHTYKVTFEATEVEMLALERVIAAGLRELPLKDTSADVVYCIGAQLLAQIQDALDTSGRP